MITKLTRHGVYAFFPFLIPEENPYDRVKIDKNKVFDTSNETGWDRLKALFQGEKDRKFHPKIVNIIHTTLATFIIGGVYGAMTTSRKTFIDFIENNEATKFESQFHAKRLLSDKMFSSFILGGVKMGIKISFFCTSLMTAYVAISTYRNKDAIWYYTAGGAYAGAIYKFPLGPKGMISGGVFGGLFGTLYGSFHYLLLKATEKTEEEYQDVIDQKSLKREQAIRKAKKNALHKEIADDLQKQMSLKPEL